MSETIQTLNITETQKLLNYILTRTKTSKQFGRAIRNYLATCLMLEAGLRVGEVVALEFSDILFAGQPVTSIVVRPEIAKNHQERIIPVSTRLADAITEYCKVVFRNKPADIDPTAWVPYPHVIPLTTRQLERIIRSSAMAALGFPIHPHTLRHTFATRLMRQVDTRIVQQLLGHSSITSTQIYTHPNSEDLHNAIQKVEQGELRNLQAGMKLFLPGGSGDSRNAITTHHDKR